jgi:methylenetetrahydrofolate--tRNA-(uracil-5-)-methyltransferase
VWLALLRPGAALESPAVITIVGAGLAGSEAALTLARLGHRVRLLEQKPLHRSRAHSSDALCELVCSNSFRGRALSNAVGLLKEELRRAGSCALRVADACSVPAGGALAVDRERFSRTMTDLVRAAPLVELVVGEVRAIPRDRPTIIATGPLTAETLARAIAEHVGAESLAYYDAIAPVVAAESIAWDEVFRASRYGKGASGDEPPAYVNCPLDREQYHRFVAELGAAEQVRPHEFEDARYFEGCLPVEVMAERGPDTLAFGPMKPVGLVDPKTGRRPYAVVQLRPEDLGGTAFGMVGFQTRMTQPEQRRVFRTIPGLGRAEFARYGAVHRNTFLDAPALLDGAMQLRCDPGLYFAGQVAGTEGYVESIAAGFLCALIVADRERAQDPRLPPPTTALGGLLAHLKWATLPYQPSNISFFHLAPWDGPRLGKRARHEALAARALADLQAWLETRGDLG